MINAILNWAEKRGSWWPAVAGFLTAFAVTALLWREPWLWLLAVPGLAMTAIRPVGTQRRNKRLIRESRDLLAEARRRAGSS